MRRPIALMLALAAPFAVLGQRAQLQYPDIAGAAQRGYAEGQANRMREIQIQQARQALEEQQQYQAQQQAAQADQEQLKQLSSQLLAATNDKDRWDLLTKIAAIDPNLAVQYMDAMHLNQPQQ